MKKITVTNEMSSQRLDKYLSRLLPLCPRSLIYKQLRKKNITLNGKKADGSETVSEGDTVEVFFSDETFDKFSAAEEVDLSRYENAYKTLKNIDIIYENENILIFNKPAGILSQSDKTGDYSVNDYLIGYLLASGCINSESMASSKPSVCNRLDRNTSGLIVCSKGFKGTKIYNEYFKSGSEKYYLALVNGCFDKDGIFTDLVKKDEKENKLLFTTVDDPERIEIKTGFETVRSSKDISLVKVRLYTGKSHQIRAHLSHLGYPIIGDFKYGGKNGIYNVSRQMLHAYTLHLNRFNDGEDADFTAGIPYDMKIICKNAFGTIEEYGI